MSAPLIVSFFTPDWRYPEHAVRLRAECAALGIEAYIEGRASAGDYLANTRQKPTFIRECLERFGRPVVWIDVDGTILRRPDYFNEPGWDFMARRMPPHQPRTWHVGTMYWHPSALPFVRAWEGMTGDMSDESALEQAWQAHGATVKARDIPATYFEIPMRGQPSPECVIFHRLSDSPSKRQQAPIYNARAQEEARARAR